MAPSVEPRRRVGSEVSSLRLPSSVCPVNLDFRCYFSLFCSLLAKQKLEEKEIMTDRFI